MNSSGISRKIDELGRIVIPIEIRKALNFKEGENIEFSIDHNKLLLKKKSIIQSNIDIIKDMENSLNSVIDGDYIIADREKILLSSNKLLTSVNLPDILSDVIDKYDDFFVLNDYSLFNLNSDFYIFKYYVDGKICGVIILYNIDSIDKYIKLIKFIGTFLNDKFSIS